MGVNMDLQRFKANLQQRVLLRYLQIPYASIATNLEFQIELLATLQDISIDNAHYVKQIIELLLKQEEEEVISEDHVDDYYELFTGLVMARPKPATEEDLISYFITKDISIKLWETPRVISGAGTTGFRTWEASLFLCEHFAQKESLLQFVNDDEASGEFKGLELGCGTGLVSMFLMKKLDLLNQRGTIYLTDGDSSLVEKLSTNLQINNISSSNNSTSMIKHKSQRLWWGEDPIPEEVDIIYAADVTYDSSVIPHLIKCIIQGLKQGIKTCLISATIRNEDTIKAFDLGLTENGLKWNVIKERKAGAVQNDGLVWYAVGTPDIRIYEITL